MTNIIRTLDYVNTIVTFREREEVVGTVVPYIMQLQTLNRKIKRILFISRYVIHIVPIGVFTISHHSGTIDIFTFVFR